MVYSITLTDRLLCYDNLLNTKLNALFAPEDGGHFAECSPFPFEKLFVHHLFLLSGAEGPTALRTEINGPSARM